MKFVEIVELLRDTAYAHSRIKGFYTGMAHEVNNGVIEYPCLRVNFPFAASPTSNVDDDKLSYTFDLQLFVNSNEVETGLLDYEINSNANTQQQEPNELTNDIVFETLQREKALQILNQYIWKLRDSENDFDFLQLVSYDINSLERYGNDFVTGVSCRLNFITINNYFCEAENDEDQLGTIWRDANDNGIVVEPIVQCIPLPQTCQEILSFVSPVLLTCVVPSLDFSDPNLQAALVEQQLEDIIDFTIPLLDFSNPDIQNALSPTQVEDIEDWILPSGCSEILSFIEPYLTGCVIPSVDYSISANQNALDPQQIEDLKDVVVPALDYTIGDDTDFNRFDGTQIDDLTIRLTPQPQQYSMFFDGLNEHITCLNNAAYNFTNVQPFSVSTWIKTSNFNRTQLICGKRIATGTFTGYTLFNDVSGVMRVIFRNNVGNGIAVEFTPPSINNWHLISFTTNGNSNASGLNVYIDGVPQILTVIENSLTGTLSNIGDFEIGRAGSAPFLGNIGITRLWNVELSPAQVLQDYNNGIMLNTPILSANCVIDFTSGTGALYTGTAWVFPDSTLVSEQTAYRSNNMEFVDRTTDVPV